MDNERIRLIVTFDQLDYIAEKAKLQLITVPNCNGDYDLIIKEDDNVQMDFELSREVRDGEW